MMGHDMTYRCPVQSGCYTRKGLLRLAHLCKDLRSHSYLSLPRKSANDFILSGLSVPPTRLKGAGYLLALVQLLDHMLFLLLLKCLGCEKCLPLALKVLQLKEHDGRLEWHSVD